MGLFNFMKNAGAKIFGDRKTPEEMAQALTRAVTDHGLKVADLKITFADGTAVVEGTTPTQAEAEKVILVLGNVEGVERVDTRLRMEKPEPEAVMYTVKAGDTLSAIARAHYGDAKKYVAIFEANRPMLKDPDKIYPGQVLRIPPQAEKKVMAGV